MESTQNIAWVFLIHDLGSASSPANRTNEKGRLNLQFWAPYRDTQVKSCAKTMKHHHYSNRKRSLLVAHSLINFTDLKFEEICNTRRSSSVTVNTNMLFCVLFNNPVKFLRIYTFSDSWTDEYGALVEWYYKQKVKYSKEKNTSTCQTIHHKSHTDCPGTKPRPPQWQNNQLTTSAMTQPKQTWYAYTLQYINGMAVLGIMWEVFKLQKAAN